MSAVLGVAVGVALVFTVGASVFEQFHQVAAEDLRFSEMEATVAGQTQILDFKDWGVTMQVPFGVDMSKLKYAAEGPDSFGLSTAALEKFGSVCSAGRNALGSIIRVPAGSPLSRPNQSARMQTSLGTIGQYSYTFETPGSDCSDPLTASREAMVVEGAAQLQSRP